MADESKQLAQHEHGENGGHDHDDHGGSGKYYVVFGMLCLLTLGSYCIAQFLMGTPTIAWAGMMAVSCGKAMLVMLFFMHLKYEANWKYVLTIPAGMMSVFLLLMLIPDVGQRTLKYSESRWLHASVPVAPGEVHADGEGHGDETHGGSDADSGHDPAEADSPKDGE